MLDSPGRILIVDDDDIMLKVCRSVLTRVGLSSDTVTCPDAALRRLGTNRYDAVVSDIRLPGMDGISLLRAVRQRDADVPLVVMTGSACLESAICAVELGALRYLQKPFSVDEFAGVVLSAVKKRVASDDAPGVDERIRHALDALWMAYQPIVQLSNRRVFSYEALFRTRAADVAGPGELLGLAERRGRLVDVGRAVRARVASDVRHLSRDTLVFVNVHPADLDDAELYSPSAPLSACAPRVVLEITERASIAHRRDLAERMRALRALGYRLAIDDLGAGYAGLTTLADMQPDFVKLDGSLVRGIEKDRTRQVLVASVLDASRQLQSAVIAEAIEAPSERNVLSNLGVDLMQGYLFARPEPPFVTPRTEAMCA